MYQRFVSYINRHGLLQQGQKVLLAISGGMDSMAMLDLFRQTDWPLAIAHCNFRLRADHSERDERFVVSTAEEMGIRVFTKRFNTTGEAEKTGESVQMAARRLRYEWLEKMRRDEGFDVIATAHHLDDSIETLLLNLTRGSGMAGLKGIPRKAGNVIRPLLFATKDEITRFCTRQMISYREDLSNREGKYARNKIRHEAIPVLKALNPSLAATMARFFDRMEATEAILEKMIAEQKAACLQPRGREVGVPVNKLNALPHPPFFLHGFIREYGFSPGDCADILAAATRQPGKRFFSDTHAALVDREEIIVYPLPPANQVQSVRVMEGDTTISFGFRRFRVSTGSMDQHPGIPRDADTLMADLDKLLFPLEMRTWRPGDRFVPLGMKGRKKVSDLLTDIKLPLHKKERIPVLVTAGNEIAWVAGIRADERFKITSSTRNYLLITKQPRPS